MKLRPAEFLLFAWLCVPQKLKKLHCTNIFMWKVGLEGQFLLLSSYMPYNNPMEMVFFFKDQVTLPFQNELTFLLPKILKTWLALQCRFHFRKSHLCLPYSENPDKSLKKLLKIKFKLWQSLFSQAVYTKDFRLDKINLIRAGFELETSALVARALAC